MIKYLCDRCGSEMREEHRGELHIEDKLTGLICYAYNVEVGKSPEESRRCDLCPGCVLAMIQDWLHDSEIKEGNDASV